ncbi:MAG: hypothetical protein H6924_08520 [Alphaproteobacteria bacterium]|nr:hypothetical protein [Alphaproteobacteria bacterium]
MKNFLGVYMGRETPVSERPDNATIARGMAAWHKWMADNADSVVVAGGPLGKTKRIGADGISDIRNRMAGFIIVKAESHEAAARLFEGHPHFSIFPGDSVEVMECLPVPNAPA